MTDNARKTHAGTRLHSFAQRKVLGAIQQTGRALPCHVTAVSGGIVTVAFDVDGVFTLPPVQMPVANSYYVREPTQVGDKGTCSAADAHLGGVSGLGDGTATLENPANLSALVFHPVGNAHWAAAPDPNQTLVQGPNGVRTRDIGNLCVMSQTPSGCVWTIGPVTMTLNASGLLVSFGGSQTSITSSGVFVTGGEVDADGTGLKTHLNSGVIPGGGLSGPAVPGAGP